MAKLLANRWFRWSLLTIALCGLGVGIYRFTPPQPMCEFNEDNNTPIKLLADGALLATIHDAAIQEPLQIWDTRTGKVVARFFPIGTKPQSSRQFSANGHYFAAETKRNDKGSTLQALELVNLLSRTTKTVQLKNFGRLQFSPNGKILVRSAMTDRVEEIEVYDSDTGNLLHKRATDQYGPWDRITADFVIYSVPPSSADKKESRKDIEIWSVSERRVVSTLRNINDGPLFSPDGRQMMVGRIPNEKLPGQWTVWDLAQRRAVADYPLPLKAPTRISPDGLWIVGASLDSFAIELRELATGKLINASRVSEMDDLAFSDDCKFLLASISGPESTIKLFCLPSMKTLWTKSSPKPREIAFARDSLTVNVITSNFLWNGYETQSGRVLVQTDPNLVTGSLRSADSQSTLVYQIHPDQDRMPKWLRFLEDVPGVNRWFRRNEELRVVRVFDTDSGRQLFHMQAFDISVPIVLSDNGRTLVTVHDGNAINASRVIRCWDVDALKPLHWAIGVPAGLAAVIGLFAWWRERRAAKVA